MHGLRAANDEGSGRLSSFVRCRTFRLDPAAAVFFPPEASGGPPGPYTSSCETSSAASPYRRAATHVCRQHTSSRDCPLMPLPSSTQPKRRAQKSTG